MCIRDRDGDDENCIMVINYNKPFKATCEKQNLSWDRKTEYNSQHRPDQMRSRWLYTHWIESVRISDYRSPN